MSADESHSRARWFWRRAIHLLLMRPLAKILFGVYVRGREHLADLDQFILIANHNSHLDIILLFNILTLKQLDLTHAVAERSYFARYRWLFRTVQFLYQPIWIERGTATRGDDPFEEFKQLLDTGHNLVIFPEGTRGKPGELIHFRSGIGRLVSQYDSLPIIPVFLRGPERALPKASALVLPLTNFVAVGPPQFVRGGHREITKHLEDVLRELGTAVSKGHQRERGRPSDPSRTIAVLGIDGSGKSTISRLIAEALSESTSACRISDRLEFYNNFLYRPLQPLGTNVFREAVNRMAKNAKSLKLYKIPKLTELLLRNQLYYEIRRWYAPDVVVMDGSPLLNLLAWVALYRDNPPDESTLVRLIEILSGRDMRVGAGEPLFEQYPELKAFWLLKLNRMVLPETVLLIDVDPATAVSRIESRGEEMQVHENVEKLTRLRESYLRVMHVLENRLGVTTAVLDGNASLETVAARATEAARRSNPEKEVVHE